jgi:hypothetical protein
MNRTRGFSLAELLVVPLAVAVAGGWIANIVKILGADFEPITTMLVMRFIGIFVAPLGAVLGYF